MKRSLVAGVCYPTAAKPKRGHLIVSTRIDFAWSSISERPQQYGRLAAPPLRLSRVTWSYFNVLARNDAAELIYLAASRGNLRGWTVWYGLLLIYGYSTYSAV